MSSKKNKYLIADCFEKFLDNLNNDYPNLSLGWNDSNVVTNKKELNLKHTQSDGKRQYVNTLMLYKKEERICFHYNSVLIMLRDIINHGYEITTITQNLEDCLIS